MNRDRELLFGDGTNRPGFQMRLSEAKSGDTKASGSKRKTLHNALAHSECAGFLSSGCE
jgi:hypothetical protein